MAQSTSVSAISATASTRVPKKKVPTAFLDLKAQHATIEKEVVEAVSRVLETQHFIMGDEVTAFESEIAAFLQVPNAIGCASGSDALLLALLASEIGPGDEVITTPFTFVATAGAVARTGAKVVFVDIDPRTYNIDPEAVSRAVTSRTRAIIPVHLFGLPANLDPIVKLASEKKLAVVEDAAQAIGSRYKGKQVGSIGTYGCFSFFPSKNLGCAGDGGLVTATDPALAKRLRLLRVHGSPKKYQYEIIGFNSRLDALQAAILRVKLKHLNEWTEGRRANAANYVKLFQGHGLGSHIQWPVEPDGYYHVYNQFVIRSPRRDALRDHLNKAGIPTDIYYPSPLHVQPAFAYLGYREGDFPNAEVASREVLALPIYPELGSEAQETVVHEIAEFFGHTEA